MKNVKFYLIGLCSFVSFCHSPHKDDYVAPASLFDRMVNAGGTLWSKDTDREIRLENKLIDRRNELNQKDYQLVCKDVDLANQNLKLADKEIELTKTKIKLIDKDEELDVKEQQIMVMSAERRLKNQEIIKKLDAQKKHIKNQNEKISELLKMLN